MNANETDTHRNIVNASIYRKPRKDELKPGRMTRPIGMMGAKAKARAKAKETKRS